MHLKPGILKIKQTNKYFSSIAVNVGVISPALNHWFLDILLKDMESITLFLMVLSDYLSGPHIRLKKWGPSQGL